MTVISYPIPPYQNLPIEPQNYQPSQFFIAAIAQGVNTTVTTTDPHNYVVSQQVRLLIPPQNGIRQLNNQTGFVLSVPTATEVVVSINSNGYDAFVTSTARTQPQIVAIGDVSTGPGNSSRSNQTTYIPGSFINISP